MDLTIVEIDKTTNNISTFKYFKGKDSEKQAENFCKVLPQQCKTLKAFIVHKQHT